MYFTHILIADYGLNLLQVAPLLPYYDIDPQVVQFLSTGVIDDENFFLEPSLQGTIFPGIEKAKRLDLLLQYKEIYNIDDHGATVGIESVSKNQGLEYLFHNRYHENAVELQNMLSTLVLIFHKVQSNLLYLSILFHPSSVL